MDGRTLAIVRTAMTATTLSLLGVACSAQSTDDYSVASGMTAGADGGMDAILGNQIVPAMMKSLTCSGPTLPPLGFCQNYDWGGVTGWHFYTCCKAKDADPKCDGYTFQGASDGVYCTAVKGDSGADEPSGGGCNLGSPFPALACTDLVNCQTECNHALGSFVKPGFCWSFTACFNLCVWNGGTLPAGLGCTGNLGDAVNVCVSKSQQCGAETTTCESCGADPSTCQNCSMGSCSTSGCSAPAGAQGCQVCPAAM
jgi:hypothetical protein